MKVMDILKDKEPDTIFVCISSDALRYCNLEITLESFWQPSGYKDWEYRVDPEDPNIPLKRHIHIAKKKHISAKNMQVSWNDDGTRHDKSSFNTSIGSMERVRDIAKHVLKIPPNITLESIDNSQSAGNLIYEISFSLDRKIAYVTLSIFSEQQSA